MKQGPPVRHKLDLRRSLTASGFVMVLMLAILGLFSLFSIWSINRAWVQGVNRFIEIRDLSATTREAQVAFKVQVQEWKNILLRGDDASLLAKYHDDFTRQAASTEKLLGDVAQQAERLGFEEDARRAAELLTAHDALNASYEAALKDLQGKAATLDAAAAHAIDLRLRGADRILEAGISRLAADTASASDLMRTNLDDAMANRYRSLRLFVIGVILGTLAVTALVLVRLIRATRG